MIHDASHSVFYLFIQYLYTGQFPSQQLNTSCMTPGDRMAAIIELLQLADEYMIDHLKEMCEAELDDCVDETNVEDMLQVADRNNAFQLRAVCMHFLRNLRP